MKEIADPGKKGHKKKTNHNQVHKKPTPRLAGRETLQTGYSWRVFHPPAKSSSGRSKEPKSREQGTGNRVQGAAIDGIWRRRSNETPEPVPSKGQIANQPSCPHPFRLLLRKGRESKNPGQQLFPIPYSLFPVTCSYDATASSTMGASRCEPLRGPRLRALITLMRSSNSCEEQFFLASRASAACISPPILCGSPSRIIGT